MSSYNFYQPLSEPVWLISHNLNTTFIAADIFTLTGNSVYQKATPSEVRIVDANTVQVTFAAATVGRARIVSATNNP